MDFAANYRDLGEIPACDLARLRVAVAAAPPSEWDSVTRQRYFKAHRYTSSIILCFGPDDDLAAADFTHSWTRWEPLLDPLLQPIITDHFGKGGKLIRLMIVRLFPGYRVEPHTDDLPVLKVSHRVHIPLVTSGAVVFVIGNQVVPMREGRIVEINNQRTHYVTNAGKDDRVHLIFDYVPADQLVRLAS
ncbi:aspartyl/asparaginyl beta-hydroxylase domain-containing protein [Nonomuraea sp. NPDC049714]|uniref:aspartyl/asparaginyl beta-hydroxylase domain-containing protein n=1 Tax=Nonomuraea sp. NPDC049714 TaxID=3364357 RepID=UPI0037B390FD